MESPWAGPLNKDLLGCHPHPRPSRGDADVQADFFRQQGLRAVDVSTRLPTHGTRPGEDGLFRQRGQVVDAPAGAIPSPFAAAGFLFMRPAIKLLPN
jgi:hypothetical protein